MDARKNFGFNILKMCFVQLLAKTIKLIEIMKKKIDAIRIRKAKKI